MIANADMQILDYIQVELRTGPLDAFFSFITHFGDAGIGWIAFALLLLVFPKTRKLGVSVGVALVLTFVLGDLVIKPLVARPRPFEANTAVHLLISAPTSYSFPSGHTGCGFAVTTALFCNKNKLWILALVLAGLIAFSRMYLYVHYPTDILGGIVLGCLCGWAATRILSAIDKKADTSHA